MKKQLIPVFLVLLAGHLFAQNQRDASTFGEIYRLSDKEARAVLVDKAPFDSTWLHTLIGLDDTLSRERLPPGHYLYLQAEQEQVFVSAFNKYDFEVTLLSTRRDLAFIVNDLAGKRITDARASLNGRNIRFDKTMQCYRLPGRKRGGVLEVQALGHFGFYDIIRSEHYSMKAIRWGRFIRTPVGRVVAVPWYFLQNSWKIIQHPQELGGLHYRKEQKWNKKEDWNGYVAFSQPKYRPGDTLKVKAWICDRKGKPWNQPVEMLSLQTSRWRQIGKKYIAPTAPGVFVYQMVLDDSLEIDLPYTFRFQNPAPRKRGLFKQYTPDPGAVVGQTYYEDYQLDEVSYHFTQLQESYFKQDSVVYHLEAKDANGMPVSDGQYKLVIRTVSTQSFYEPEVLLPDTLWQTGGAISANGEMDIRLPDQFLPAAAYNVLASLYVTNSAGELQTFDLRSSIDRLIPKFDGRIKDGWVQIDWKGAGAMPQHVLLQESYPNAGINNKDSIALPYRAKVKPEVVAYTVTDGRDNYSIRLNDALLAGHQVTHRAFRNADTVFFLLQNPQRIPVQFGIWSGKNKVGTGVTSDSLWTRQITDREGDNYYIRYTFVWGGDNEQAEATVPFYKNQLDVSLEQPENVQPGDQVQVKIRVTDASSRPAAGAELTAGAYNSLFGNDVPYEVPGVKYKYKPGPLLYNPFIINALEDCEYYFPISDKWYERLHLDRILYYRLRRLYAPASGKKPVAMSVSTDIYPNAFPRTNGLPQNPNPGILPDLPIEADLFSRQQPQFAPFVVENFQSQPVYMIWVNQVLVYYYGNTDKRPYSFYGESGYNTIKIRLRNGEYTLDSVYLENGKKETFSFYGADWGNKFVRLNAPGNTLQHARIRWEPRPDSLQSFEKSYLQKTMLFLRDSPDDGLRYFWDNARNIHIINEKNSPYHIIGPFPPDRPINVLSPNRFISRFKFEPGYEYDISAQHERLYAKSWPAKMGRFPRKLPLRSINDWAIGPHQILRGYPVYQFMPAGMDKPGAGSLRIHFSKKDTILQAIVLQRDSFNGLYAPGTSNWYGLLPGNYQLRLYTSNNFIAEKNIRIQRDTLLCLLLSDLPFRPAKTEEKFDSLYQSKVIKNSMSGSSQSPAYYRSLPSGWSYGTYIEGKITDQSGEVLIGATVKLMQGAEFIRGTITDYEGNYRIEAPPGTYTLEVDYTGYVSQRTTGIHVFNAQLNYLNQTLSESSDLQEVVVTGYSIRGNRQNLTSSDIVNLPTRSVNALLQGTTAGVEVKGARPSGVNYYLDSIRVTGAIPPLQDVEELAGAAQIRFRFRDYAYWQPHLTTDVNGEVVFQATFPDDLTTWESYAIATAAKGRAGIGKARTRAFKYLTAQLAVPRFAIAGDQFEVAGRVSNHKSDSVAITTRFLLNDKVIGSKNVHILEGTSEYLSLEIPAGLDTAVVAYEMKSDRNSDGELRKIPVLPAGTLETKGQFFALDSDTTFNLSFPAGPYPLTLHAESNPLDLLLQDVEYLYNYPYGCNEQTASRLIALLSMKKIKVYQKQPFQYEKDLRLCLKKLKNNQLPDGAWGWWANGASNHWMTIYVARALFTAKKADYPVEGLDKALTAIRLYLPSMNSSDQCAALTLLRECGVNVDCAPFLLQFESMRMISMTDRLNRLRLKQLCEKELVRDSLLKYVKRTTFGGIYFGTGETGWYGRRAIQTLQAYEIAQTAGWTDITKGIERYWLQSRPVQRNTIETASILEALLPALLGKDSSLHPVQLRINGQLMDTFPVSMRLDPAQGQSVQVTKTGSGPLFLTAYQQWHNANPAARSDLFEVHTQILLANGVPADNLHYGESATLEVRVEVKEAADYVMIEAPIPAGCSYGEKVQKGWPEVHREYFKDRTAIFCERLPVGKYSFQVPLEPRFTGRFTLNPVRVEQMYFPVFYGRNELKKIKVER